MELTNHSYLDTRRNYLSAYSDRKIASDRISNGNRLESDKHDLGAIGVAAKISGTRIQNFATKTNLQNFHTYLSSQAEGMEHARRIYERMNQLAIQALDPTLGDVSTPGSDLKSLNREFQELAENLDEIVNSEVNGQRLFGGRNVDFTDGISDVNTDGITPKFSSVDVGTTSGTMEIKFSTGRAPDQLYLFRGELPDELKAYFDATTYYDNSGNLLAGARNRMIELQGKLDDHFKTNGLFTTGAWATPGSAQEIDESKPAAGDDIRNYDTFTVTFNDCTTDVDAEFDPDNNSSNPMSPNANQNAESNQYGQAQMNDLMSAANGGFKTGNPDLANITGGTTLTMIGLNYNSPTVTDTNSFIYEVKANFSPSLPTNDLIMPDTGTVMPGLSFGSLGCADISTKDNAETVLASIAAELENLTDSMATVASFQKRTESQIEHLNSSEVTYEAVSSRIEDTDFAKEATSLAKNTIKTEMAAHMLSKSARLKDVLIPLTTDHFRSHFLKSTL